MQQLQMKQLSIAVAAAFASAMAADASALVASEFNSSPNDTAEIWLSGSSGQDPGLNAAISRMCVAGTLDKYADGSAQAAFFCSTNTSLVPGISKGKMVIYKSSVNGSGNGVTPLLGSGSSIAFMSMNTIKTSPGTTNCTILNTAGAVTAGSGAVVPAFVNRNCTAGTTQTNGSHIPDAGLSDEEPVLFSDDPAATSMPQEVKNALVFGIAVSESLYRALQQIQGLNSTDVSTDATNNTVVSRAPGYTVRDNEANMPSLSRDVIGSLMNGNILDWSTLKGSGGTSMPTLAVKGTTTVTADPTVYIARRTPTSGTQKWTQVFLYNGIDAPGLSKKCYAGASAPLYATDSSESNTDGTGSCGAAGKNGNPADPNFNPVFQGSGSGDVRNCLIAQNAQGHWAIGLISTESTFQNAAGGFRFVKIDGYAPSLANVVAGKYKSWVEQSVNKGTYFGGLPSDNQNVVNKLFTSLGDTTNITALNSTQGQVWGAGALLQLPTIVTPTYPAGGLTQANVQANPVNFLSKSVSGTVDNCAEPVFFPGNPANQTN
jgi:hypothetical protein